MRSALRNLLPSMFHRRLLLLVGVMVSVIVVLGTATGMLTTGQSFRDARAMAESKLSRSEVIQTSRGAILDRNGLKLAVDETTWELAIHYDMLTGGWAYDMAYAEARRDKLAWSEMSAREKDARIAKLQVEYDQQAEEMFQTLAGMTGMSNEELRERCDEQQRQTGLHPPPGQRTALRHSRRHSGHRDYSLIFAGRGSIGKCSVLCRPGHHNAVRSDGFGNLLDDLLPGCQGPLAAVCVIGCRPRPVTHFLTEQIVVTQALDHFAQLVGTTAVEHKSALILVNNLGNFTVFGTHEDDRPAGGQSTIELRWNNQAGQFLLQRNDVNIRNCQADRQHCIWLVRLKRYITELHLLDLPLDLAHPGEILVEFLPIGGPQPGLE